MTATTRNLVHHTPQTVADWLAPQLAPRVQQTATRVLHNAADERATQGEPALDLDDCIHLLAINLDFDGLVWDTAFDLLWNDRDLPTVVIDAILEDARATLVGQVIDLLTIDPGDMPSGRSQAMTDRDLERSIETAALLRGGR